MSAADAKHAGGWDALETRVSSGSGMASALPEYRRAWFLSLIRQGRAAEDAGRSALAAHCRARVETELAALAALASAQPAPSVSSAKTPRAASPFEALAARRDGAARARILALLDCHAARLSSAEWAAYRTALEAASDAQLSELRRRLVDRLLRAARFRRQGARLSAWKPAAPEAVAGPYNDYRALEQVVHRVAATHPGGAEWAAEFFDVYARMDAVRRIYGEFIPGKTG